MKTLTSNELLTHARDVVRQAGSQDVLARMAGVSVATVSKYLNREIRASTPLIAALGFRFDEKIARYVETQNGFASAAIAKIDTQLAADNTALREEVKKLRLEARAVQRRLATRGGYANDVMLLRRAVEKSGGVPAFAGASRYGASTVNEVMRGKRRPPADMMRHARHVLDGGRAARIESLIDAFAADDLLDAIATGPR